MSDEKTFDVGERVYIESGYGTKRLVPAVIDRKTKTGRIVLKGMDCQFRPDGWLIGGGDYSTERIVKSTPLNDSLWLGQSVATMMREVNVQFINDGDRRTLHMILSKARAEAKKCR